MAIALGWKAGVAVAVTLFAGWTVTHLAAGNEAMRLAKEFGRVREGAINAPEVRITSSEGASRLIPHLSDVPDLYKLGVYSVSLTPEQLKEIAKLDHVSVLKLGTCDLTDEDVALLSSMKRLEVLHLGGNPITDEALKSIAKMQDLQELDLSRTHIQGHMLGDLSQLKILREIRLNSTKVSDETLAELESLHRLEVVSLRGTEISTEGLKSLTSLHWLRRLGVPEERIYGKATHDHLSQRRETVRQFWFEFNNLKRERYQQAVARGKEVPEQFTSPFPDEPAE